ncbi:hypothetical protein Catovirus_2_326 [Catovirus CTV1]|uniref:Uncharacterized protein n=1 Tax=Catovirus CTV1 TaxID=1977631 RepID=A0A1V0SCE4_9VIRU|nr:hypothetical protein Catovirus_2_326 [Catovirus CTV1]
MPYSPAFSAIIIYIIIILVLAMLKPDFLYDHQNNKFRDFGFTQGKSVFTLLTVGIIISFLTYNFVIMFVPHYPRNNYVYPQFKYY